MKLKIFFKIIIINLILFSLIVSKSYSKPIPPGSGKGDVPANILILLDSSVSMRNLVAGNMGTYGIDWAVELSDGNIIFAENGRGFSKIITSTGERDLTFAGGAINFRGTNKDSNCGNKNSQVNKSWAGDVTSSDIVYGVSTQNGGQIIAIDSDGKCVDVIGFNKTKIAMPALLEIREIDNDEILFVAGRTHDGGKKARMYVKNLTSGKEKRCSINNNHHFGKLVSKNKAVSMTISNNGDYIYVAAGQHLVGYTLTKDSNDLYCPTDGNWDYFINTGTDQALSAGQTNALSDDIKDVFSIKYSVAEDNKIYATSKNSHLLQKISIDHTSTSASLDFTIGKNGPAKTLDDKDPGDVDAADVEFNLPGMASSSGFGNNIFTSATRVLVGDRNSFIHKFDENKMTDALKDTAWRARYGGAKKSKFDGAKDAIEEIVTDSSLTSGANYGFGHWNSGTNDSRGGAAWNPDGSRGGGEKWCHFVNWCYYMDNGWMGGTHPVGTSDRCLNDYCLEDGVSATGASEIVATLPTIGMAWGTDGNAFADIAYQYFGNRTGETPVIDKVGKPCQQNYVIVISDGHIRNSEEAFRTLAKLRDEYEVTTLMVGYGGSYQNANAKVIFDRLARAGSCESPGGYFDSVNPVSYEGLDNKTGCESPIDAETPADLKTEISSKIRQIIAERLSFTAPSITATLEEGGSIYQAQFNYKANKEWRGHLYRYQIDGDVIQDSLEENNGFGNWDAGERLLVKGSTGRKIWTAIDTNQYGDAGYTGGGGWNNWNTSNAGAIQNLFEATGNAVRDYHNSGSTCGLAGTDGVEDGIDDDVKGLINFVRGVDYFNYKGTPGGGACPIDEDRDWILGDIYHSQLIEVGPPGASTNFFGNNQEKYWRSTKGYGAFKTANQNRTRVVYAGSNGGTLHAFNAKTGDEEWAFVPPMIAAQLPLLVNKSLDGQFGGAAESGGTNPIFAVDGSPVVHDAFIYGLNDGGTEYQNFQSWRTLLMIPYGRGGAGFSVLDVTKPTITVGAEDEDGNFEPGSGPLHMFSIYNDAYNKEVVRVDHNGVTHRIPYQRSTISIEESFEAVHAANIYQEAETKDIALGTYTHDAGTPDDTSDDFQADFFTNREAKAACQGNSDYAGGDFVNTTYDGGATTCFTDNVFTFDIELPDSAVSSGTVKDGILSISKLVSDDWVEMTGVTATYDGSILTVNFGTSNPITVDQGISGLSDVIKIDTTCEGQAIDNKEFDYSGLGETWSTPRIVRIPSSSGASDHADDRYVAVMGGGMGSGTKCVGSGIIMVDLEAGHLGDNTELEHKAGRLFGSVENAGFMRILDSEEKGYKIGITGEYQHASPIVNSIPATPIVITADNVPQADWRGAMVYINDLEGKVMKINLTSEGTLFEQQFLMNLQADNVNKRFSFFEMDAAIGGDSGNLWLFGGTGNFNRISEKAGEDGKSLMDNIVYGIRDRDFPNFVSKNSPKLVSGSENFILDSAVAFASDNTPRIERSSDCVNTTDEVGPVCKVTTSDEAWRYHLGEPDANPESTTGNKFRKTSAAPTVYRGKVYFPIYEPAELVCELGTAYVCAYDDECGYLDSLHIDSSVAEGSCYKVGSGILSKLVVHGGSMFANLAGPEESEDTLVRILASEKQFRTFRNSWRENF